MHRAQPADHHHQQQIDGLQDAELVGREEADLVRVQRSAQPGQRRRHGEGQRLVARQVDAHALRRDLRVADRDEGPPGGRAQQVEHAQRAQDGGDQAHEVEGLPAAEVDAEQVRRLHVQPRVAAGNTLPAREHLLDDEAEGQRGDAQVDALDAQRRHGDHHAHRRREQRRRHHRQREGHAQVDQHALRVGPGAQEGRVPDRELPGEAGQQHQPQAHHRIDEHEVELREPVFVERPGRGQQREAEQRIPEAVPAVLGERDVLRVAGLEEEAHDGPATPSS